MPVVGEYSLPFREGSFRVIDDRGQLKVHMTTRSSGRAYRYNHFRVTESEESIHTGWLTFHRVITEGDGFISYSRDLR